MTRWPVRSILCSGAVAFALLSVGCSSETRDDVGEAADSVGEEIEDAAGTASASAVASSYAAAIRANSTVDDEGARSIVGLQESAADLPGEPEITGIEDTNGDGLDDDGQVSVMVGDQGACLILSETGEEIDINSEAC